MTDVHQALSKAAASSRSKGEMRNFSVRLPEGVKEPAQEICARNGTDLGTYLRECAKALISDYGLPVSEG